MVKIKYIVGTENSHLSVHCIWTFGPFSLWPYPTAPPTLLYLSTMTITILKGQCHEIFCFWFFSWISFPPAPEYPIRTVSNFFENSRRYSQVKVHHRCQRSLVLLICVMFASVERHRRQICRRYQRHRWQFATGINDTGGKFAAGVNDPGGK